MKKRFGCLRPVFFVLLAIAVLYFTAGEGKTVILKKIYPIKYQQYVEQYSNEFSVDKNLIYAIIKVESNFDRDAVSVAGAKGLMQLMDDTAADCSKKAGFDYIIPADLYVPEKNIRLGCFYISQLMSVYGDTKLAITAYNGGTGNVDSWLSDPQYSDGNGGLSDIPYEETKNYVKKVLNAFEEYNRLYKTNEQE